MQGSTRSESTNHLIATCRDAAAGRCSTAVVEALLSEREQGLAQNAEAFDQKLAGESAEFARAVRPQREAVRLAFQEYGQALREVRAWLRTGDATTLERALQRLATVGNGVLDALAAWDMAVMTARGPTDHPILNALLTACAAPGLDPNALAPIVTQARGMVEQASTGALGSHPLVERLRAGASEYTQALDHLTRFTETGDRAHLEQGVAIVTETAASLQSGATLLREAAARPGPTGFPLANALLNARDAIADGRVPLALVAEITGTLEAAFTKMRGALTQALRAGGQSALVAEEAQRATEALALHAQAITEVRQFILEGDGDLLASGLDKLEQAVRALEQAKTTFDQIAAREGKTVCVWCNRPNDPSMLACGGCGRLLPRWAEGAASSTFSIDEGGDMRFAPGEAAHEHVEQLAEAVQAAASGEQSPAALGAHLDAFAQRVRAGEARLRVGRGETADLAREALATMASGLTELRAWLDDGDAAHLDSGMQTVRDGAAMLHEAQQTARERLQGG